MPNLKIFILRIVASSKGYLSLEQLVQLVVVPEQVRHTESHWSIQLPPATNILYYFIKLFQVIYDESYLSLVQLVQ